MPETRPRIWRARIWTKGGPFEGTGFVYKTPVDDSLEPAITLAAMAAEGTISRFQLSPVPARTMRSWTREDREHLERFGPTLDRVATRAGIDWDILTDAGVGA